MELSYCRNIEKGVHQLYFLRQLKGANIAPKDVVTFYTTCIRPIMEYAVFHHGLPKYHARSDQLESLQKHAFRIIFPLLSSRDAMPAANLISLREHCCGISAKLFAKIISNQDHKQ